HTVASNATSVATPSARANGENLGPSPSTSQPQPLETPPQDATECGRCPGLDYGASHSRLLLGFENLTVESAFRFSRVDGARMTTRPLARLLGVGAAAPALRLSAGDVGAAWGRSGRGQVAICAPDEDTLTLAWDASSHALRAANVTADEIDALYWGT